MALPAGEGGGNVEGIVTEIKGLVSGLLFKVATNTKNTNDQLGAIRLQTMQSAKYLGDLVAAAELELEAMIDDAEKEDPDLEAPDAEKIGEGGPTIELLTQIAEATRQTAEQTKVMADAVKEQGEDVLDPVPDTETPVIKTDAEGKPKADTKKSDMGLMGALAAILGGVLGTIAGLFSGWLKALKFIFNRGFIKTLSQTFANFFKNLKTSFKGGALAKGFARIGAFFARIGAFFGKIFKIFGTIAGFIKNVVSIAGKVMSVVSKIFAPLLIIFGIFETIKGFFDGFANTEGSFLEKLMGGLAGALTGFLDFLIAAPLNLIKGIIGWIAGALGFDGVKEKLESFDFSFGGIVNAVFDVIKFVAGIAFKILKFPVALAAGIAGGIAALLPGGKSPKEGFMDAFNAVMNFGSGGKPPVPGEGDGDSADAISEGAPTNDDAAKEVMDEKSPPESKQGQVTRDNVFPFKMKGFKDVGMEEDEYYVMGENPAGGYFIHPADGKIRHHKMIHTRKNEQLNAFVDSAVDDAVGTSAALSMGFGGAGVSASDELAAIQSKSGASLTDRQAELAAKRETYGTGSSTVVTNVGGSSSSSTTTQVVVKPQAPAETRKGTGASAWWSSAIPS